MAKDLNQLSNEELKYYVRKQVKKLSQAMKHLKDRESVDIGLNLQIAVITDDEEKDYVGDILLGKSSTLMYLASESESLNEMNKLQFADTLSNLVNDLEKE